MLKTFATSLVWFCLAFTHAYASAPAEIDLNLHDAIMFGIRENPNVQSQELSYESSKFNLWVQRWAFLPHYNLQASASFGQNRHNNDPFVNTRNFNLQPTVTLLTPIGTQINLSASNAKSTYYNPGVSVEIIQPLMRGFGKPVVEAAYHNAEDSLRTQGLSFKGALQTTVTNVINAYLDFIQAQSTIIIAEDALKRSEATVKQTKYFIQAGRKAGNELVTVEANVASAKSQLENDKNQLQQSQYALLTAIGLDPSTPIHFQDLDLSNLIKQYKVPSLDQTKALVLCNDIQYQTDQITIRGATRRQLMLAQDQARPQLNLSINAGSGNGSNGGWNAGMNSIFNGVNLSRTIGLTLQIPIDNQLAKQSIYNAKIALRQAELALKQEKWSKETTAINNWNAVNSAKRSLSFAEDAERLQQKTYKISYQKYVHGLIDSLELQSAQLSLIGAQEKLLSAKIGYLKSLVNIDLITGHTLATWKIPLRCR